jgi:hypothetical protein
VVKWAGARVKGLKGLIVTFCIGWKSDNEDETQGKSGRWTTAKDAPQPKGLTLIPENEDGKKNILIM